MKALSTSTLGAAVLLCCCVVAAVGDVTSAAADSSLLSRWQEVLKAGGRARGGERGRTEE